VFDKSRFELDIHHLFSHRLTTMHNNKPFLEENTKELADDSVAKVCKIDNRSVLAKDTKIVEMENSGLNHGREFIGATQALL
jgi:hypothetical protein